MGWLKPVFIAHVSLVNALEWTSSNQFLFHMPWNGLAQSSYCCTCKSSQHIPPPRTRRAQAILTLSMIKPCLMAAVLKFFISDMSPPPCSCNGIQTYVSKCDLSYGTLMLLNKKIWRQARFSHLPRAGIEPMTPLLANQVLYQLSYPGLQLTYRQPALLSWYSWFTHRLPEHLL